MLRYEVRTHPDGTSNSDRAVARFATKAQARLHAARLVAAGGNRHYVNDADHDDNHVGTAVIDHIARNLDRLEDTMMAEAMVEDALAIIGQYEGLLARMRSEVEALQEARKKVAFLPVLTDVIDEQIDAWAFGAADRIAGYRPRLVQFESPVVDDESPFDAAAAD